MNPIILYDVFTDQTLCFNSGKEVADTLGVDVSAIFHLRGDKIRNKCILNRYILPENKHLIFTLIDLNTEKEYHCINNYSLFLQISEPYTENYGKYIYALKIRRQTLASIGQYNFYLKGYPPQQFLTTRIKYQSPKFLELHKKQKLQEKIARNLRGRIAFAMRAASKIKKISKIWKTEKLVGCSFEEFIVYIESLFLPGMNWENYGKYTRGDSMTWHIDHIKQVHHFNLEDPEQQKICFHYTNMRPLWAIDNLTRKRKNSSNSPI